MGALSKRQHQEIFSLFLDTQELRHAEIARRSGMKPNLLDYHLKQLLEEGVLEKKEDTYRVTSKSEYLIPQFKQVTGEEKLKLPVVLFAIEHDGKILLIQRKTRPYKGYWGLPGGKIRFDETIAMAAERIALRETGIQVSVTKVCSVIDEHVVDDQVKNGWFLFLVKAKVVAFPDSLPSNADWFSSLDCKIIPSDKWMIEQGLHKTTDVQHIVLQEKDGKIKE